jgi:hypothetical protein
MRYLVIILLSLTLFSCQTPSVAYFQHYENCMNYYSQMAQIAQCGKSSRNDYIAKSGGRGRGDTGDGDQFAIYVDTLAQTVREGRRSDSEAKLQMLQTISTIKQNYMMAAAAIYGAQQAQSDALINQGLGMMSGKRGLDGQPRTPAPSMQIPRTYNCTEMVISRNPYMTKQVCN